jgi:hypothetical protein
MNDKKFLNYLRTFHHSKEFVLISFFITNPESVRKIHLNWKNRDEAHKRVIFKSKNINLNSSQFGGFVGIVDPENLKQGILKKIKCPVATGLCYNHGSLFIGSKNKVSIFTKGRIMDELNNNLFNDIHGISKYNNNILVVCTGTDSLVEINPKTGKIEWDWLATEGGLNKSPDGRERKISRLKNYQKISTITPEHTTHINSVLTLSNNNILATLFHQGQIVNINRSDKEHVVLLNNLKCPHFIRKINSGYSLADSGNNQAILLRENFSIDRVFVGDYNWVQDFLQLNNGSFLLADSNNFRIVLLDSTGNKIDSYSFGKKKIFTFLSIKNSDLQELFIT